MANEEEMESFDISERDWEDAFAPGQWRSNRKFTKNQQIYGVFNEEEDGGSGDEAPSRMFKGAGKGKKSLTTPVGFVRGGIHQVGGTKDEKKEDKDTKKVKLVDMSSDSEEDEDEEETEEKPSSTRDTLNELILESITKKAKRQNMEPAQKTLRDIASTSTGKQTFRRFNKEASLGNLGDWEKHGSGIGSKLLLQMGFQPGKGLGKNLQGRTAPVEAVLRKGRGAIGAYGTERKAEPVLTAQAGEEEDSEAASHVTHWRKGERELKKSKEKTTYVYRTAEEVMEEASKGGVTQMAREYTELSKVKVIDMTGPEQRVLSGYSALGGRKKPEPTDLDGELTAQKQKVLQLDKLTANLDTLVEMCEQEIIQNAKELTYNEDRIIALESEEKNLSSLVKNEEKQMATLNSLIAVLEQLEKGRAEGSLSLENLLDNFTKIEEKCGEDYINYDMANIALSYLIPLVKQRLQSTWRPLEGSNADSCEMFWKWRPLLEFKTRVKAKSGFGKEDNTTSLDPFHGLVWHAWMPVFRSIFTQWNCKKAEPMIDLLDSWEQLIPEWVMENILDQLLLPRIQREVENWNPVMDLIPIHSWIHPWLPRLGSRLEVVYPIIRQKMSLALTEWHPSDQSARSVLLPWVPVFSKGSMDAFLIKNILPKLEVALMEWTINPSLQQLDVWRWTMEWKDLMPVASMVAVLEKAFFPKWLQVLVTWLNHAPNYEEIAQWYTGWKALFPPLLAQHPSVKEQLGRALDLMNRSLAAGGQVSVPAPPPPVIGPRLVAPPPPVISEPVGLPQGFRELVEYKCAQEGILFVPMVNRWQEGRPVFRVGNVLSYFDRQVVFVLSPNGIWMPVSVQQLMEMAVS